MAGGQGKTVVSEVVENVNFVRLDNEMALIMTPLVLVGLDLVVEDTLNGVHEDVIARTKSIQIEKRCTVSRPVTGYGGVAFLSRPRRCRVVSRAEPEIVTGNAVDQRLLHTERRDVQASGGLSEIW